MRGKFRINKSSKTNRAFTLIEIIVVVSIIGLVYSVVFTRGSYFSYYKQEGFLRKLTETIAFLHQRAIIDGHAYKISFDFGDPLDADKKPYYQIFEVVTQSSNTNATIDDGTGNLSKEIANIISATFNEEQEGIAPKNFPSLREREFLPEGISIKDLHLQTGIVTQHSKEELPSVYFSPQGFSDFAVLHFKVGEEGDISVLINPFTGLSQIFREYKDFEWSFGRQKK